jgi:hypothetical protein
MRKPRWINTPIILALFCAGVLCVPLVLIWLVSMRTNISETKIVVDNISGAGFDVVEANTDTLAKDQFVSVYVYDSGSRSNWLKRLVHPRVLLFRYDPWNWDEPMPRIEADGPDHVRISLGRASSVTYQEHQYKRIGIEYAIGFVQYH